MSTSPLPIQASPKWLVQAPDGKTIQFPDEFSEDDVNREMTKMYGDPTQKSLAMISPEGRNPLNKVLAPNAYGLPGQMEPTDVRSREKMLTPPNQERMQSGESMAVPAFLMSVGAMGPVGAIERQGVGQGLKTLGQTAFRGALGTYAGSKVGGPVGKGIGELFGQNAGEVGEKIGQWGGGLYGGYKMASDPELVSRLPFLGKFLSSPEEYAESLASQRVANQLAMEKAVADNPEAQERAMGSFMNRGYKSAIPEPEEPPEPPEYKPYRPGKNVLQGDISRQGGTPGVPKGSNPSWNYPGAPGRIPGANLSVGSTPGTGEAGTIFAPEPNEALPEDRPGAMWSVPREQLPKLAHEARPGAANVARQTGRTVIYVPKGSSLPWMRGQ